MGNFLMEELLNGGAKQPEGQTRKEEAIDLGTRKDDRREGNGTTYSAKVGRPAGADGRKLRIKGDKLYVRTLVDIEEGLFLKYKALARMNETSQAKVFEEALEFAMENIEKRQGEIKPLQEDEGRTAIFKRNGK